MEFKNSGCHTQQKKVMKQITCGVQGVPAHQGLNTHRSNSTWSKASGAWAWRSLSRGFWGRDCTQVFVEVSCSKGLACDVHGEHHHGRIGRVG